MLSRADVVTCYCCRHWDWKKTLKLTWCHNFVQRLAQWKNWKQQRWVGVCVFCGLISSKVSDLCRPFLLGKLGFEINPSGLEGLSVRKSSWRHWCILQQDHTQDAVVRIHSFQHWAIDALNYLILLGMDSEMLFLVACVCLLAGLQRGETFKIDQLDGLNGSKIQIIGAKSCKELVTPII